VSEVHFTLKSEHADINVRLVPEVEVESSPLPRKSEPSSVITKRDPLDEKIQGLMPVS
jgi:hypothetical protein